MFSSLPRFPANAPPDSEQPPREVDWDEVAQFVLGFLALDAAVALVLYLILSAFGSMPLPM